MRTIRILPNVSHYHVSVANVTDNSNISEWSNERLCYETQGDDLPFPSSDTHSVLGVFCKEPVVGNTIRIQLLSTHTQHVLCDVYVSQGELNNYSISFKEEEQTYEEFYKFTWGVRDPELGMLNVTIAATSINISTPAKTAVCEVKVYGGKSLSLLI
ncbi:hypothetical protein DPMN_180660 [Dreissena polymorpha]|uniref:Uncharacterized protein n=1 Tax=Dreissena polymorpha TaxID=45954 RepID=A0A9D4ILU7_DREPO|nr:hypothetical protein DPMN_180660 [Dreissena polymorpha]